MKTFILSGALVLLTMSTFGQAEKVLQRAKEVSNQNNVRQGVPSPAPAVAPARPGTAAPSNTVTQAQSLAALQNDLAGFKTGTAVTEAQKQQFTVDLAKAVRGQKPSLTTVKKFVESLTTAASAATFTDEQRNRLALNLDAVLNSRGISAPQFDKIIADTQAILEVGTIKRANAISIAADLKAVGAEIRR